MRVFSRRNEEVVFQKGFLSIPKRVRIRLWNVIDEYDEAQVYNPYPGNNWTENTSAHEQVVVDLKDQYGIETLVAPDDDGNKVQTDLKGLVQNGYPAQVFDTIEALCEQLSDSIRAGFQRAVNEVLEDESMKWRLIDGQFFKIDSTFLTQQIVIKASELLKARGFEGALDEFKEARNDFTAEDYKGAIHNACKSMESVLKVIEETNSGNASQLIRALVNTDFYEGIPYGVGQAFGESVLMSLPFIRNRLGGHGQGGAVVDPPKEYAELTIHLAGSIILFLIHNAIRVGQLEKDELQHDDISDDDLPF